MTTPKTDYDPDFTLEELVRWRPELNGAWLMVNPELPIQVSSPTFYINVGTGEASGDVGEDIITGKKLDLYSYYLPISEPRLYSVLYHPHFLLIDGKIYNNPDKTLADITLVKAAVQPANYNSRYGIAYDAYNWVKPVLIHPGAPAGTVSQNGIIDLCPVSKCLLDIIYIAERADPGRDHQLIIPKYPLRRLYNQWKAETKPVDLLGAPPRHTPTLEITETAPINTNVLLPDLSPIRDAIRHTVALSRPMPAGTDKKAQLASVHEALTQLLRRVEELV